jgi:pimeloyl-ACP methyl ester carboxylesterase
MIHYTFQREPIQGRLLRGDVRIREGPPPRSAVVVIHGFKSFKDWAFFPHVCRSLAASGHAVISFNFSGSGIGSHPERFTELEAFAANTFSREVEEVGWVVEWVMTGDLLPCKPASIGLLGHSRGGGDAILHASDDRRVGALITWSAISTFDRWSSEKRAEWLEAGRVHVLNSRTGQEMPLDVGLLQDLERNRARLDVESAASRVAAPWLILHGGADQTVGLEEGQALARAAPSGRLCVVAGAGHTYGVGHPFCMPSRELAEAVEVSVTHLSLHLGEG